MTLNMNDVFELFYIFTYIYKRKKLEDTPYIACNLQILVQKRMFHFTYVNKMDE